MAATTQKWTDITVKKLKGPSDRPYVDHVDPAVPGLAVRVTATGTRLWRVSGSNKIGGKWQSYQRSLGKYPAVTLGDARAAALAIIAAAKAGQTVRKSAEVEATAAKAVVTKKEAAKADREAKDTFENVRTAFLTAKEAAKRRSATLREYTRFLNMSELEPWATKPIREIDRREVFDLIELVQEARGSIIANKLFVVLRAFFNWSMKKLKIDTTPTHGLEAPQGPRKKDRVLSDDELRIAYLSMGAAGVMAPLLRLLALTGQRRGELAALQWSEVIGIDGKTPMISLPGTRTKNKLPHNVPLAPTAVECLRAVPATKSEFVFTSTGKTAVSGFSKAKAAVDKAIAAHREQEISEAESASDDATVARLRATFQKDWTLHDLRRTLVTGMNERKVLPHIVEAVVNHVSGPAKAGTAGVYNVAAYDDEKREALKLWARHLQLLVDAAPTQARPMLVAA